MRKIIINLIVIVFLFASCEKENNTSSKGDQINLIIRVNGIKDVESSNPKQAGLLNSYTPQFAVDNSSSTISLNEVALEVSSETQSMIAFDKGDYRNKLQSKKLASTSSPVEVGVKYWLLLFNTTTQQIEQSVEITVGNQVTSIPVTQGQEYQYYAYSYNNTVQMTDPSLSNYIIDTPTDKALVYASGTITSTFNNRALNLTFEHKLAQVVVQVDYDRLFGTVTNIDAKFASNTYLNRGKFSVLTGQIDNTTITTYAPSSSIVFTEDDTENQVKSARYYVADPSLLTSFTINIDQLDVKYINNSDQNLINTTRPVVFGSPANPYVPAIGKQLVGKIKLWKYFNAKTVLHFTAQTSPGYAAESGASYNMINENLNYGTDPRSLCKFSPGTINAFTSHVIKNPTGLISSIDTYKPDIIIMALGYSFTIADVQKLLAFVNAGGVLINFADERSIQEGQLFLQTFFDDDGITVAKANGGVNGYVYTFLDINDEILNGAFGDVRKKYWGADAAHGVQANNIISTDITIYSSNSPVNGDGSVFPGVNMFKHQRKHLFWIGDGGFLSSPSPNGYSTFLGGHYVVPFSTVRTQATLDLAHQLLNPNPLFNYDNYPYPKPGYGRGFTNQRIYDIYNSTFFANIMSWAVVNAEFFGYNTGGLPPTPVNP